MLWLAVWVNSHHMHVSSTVKRHLRSGDIHYIIHGTLFEWTEAKYVEPTAIYELCGPYI
jgi:hypothetical protein